MSDYDGGDLEPLDVEIEDATPGTDLAVRGGAEVEPSDVVDGEIVQEADEVDGLVLEGAGLAYHPHGPVSSDVSPAAITGEGSSGGGFHWTKPERGGGGGGGGGGKPKPGRRRRRGGGSGGGGVNVSLFGGLFSGASLLKTGAIGSNNALVKADGAGANNGLFGKRPPARRRTR